MAFAFASDLCIWHEHNEHECGHSFVAMDAQFDVSLGRETTGVGAWGQRSAQCRTDGAVTLASARTTSGSVSGSTARAAHAANAGRDFAANEIVRSVSATAALCSADTSHASALTLRNVLTHKAGERRAAWGANAKFCSRVETAEKS